MYLKIALAVSVFLLYASFIGFSSYGPYNILRFVVCLFSVFSACLWYGKSERFMWAFVTMAIVMNPIMKIHLSRSTWTVVDLIFAGIILVSTWLLYRED